MKHFALERTEAEVTNLNLRKEKHGNTEKAWGYDLNFKIEVAATMLNALSEGQTIDYASLLFDANQNPIDGGMTSMTFDRRFNDHVISISTVVGGEEAMVLDVNKICKFKASVGHSGMVELSFQAQLNALAKGQTDKLLGKALYTCYITIDEPRQLDIED